MKTTHDAQMQRYVEEYRGPETVATDEPRLTSEIASLLQQIADQQREILEAQTSLDRLTEKNLATVRDALAGKH